RRFGPTTLALHVLGRFAFSENGHGYRAGDRYDASLTADRRLARRWRVQAGLHLAREQAERWGGIVEEEGNLGRTDVLASAALAREIGAAGALTLDLKVPLYTHAVRAQL